MSKALNATESFLQQYPDIELFEVILTDLSGGLRGKWVTRDKIEKVMAGGLKLPLSTLAFDVWGRDAEASYRRSKPGKRASSHHASSAPLPRRITPPLRPGVVV